MAELMKIFYDRTKKLNTASTNTTVPAVNVQIVNLLALGAGAVET